MADVVDAITRSRMMAGIRGRDTKPELFIRRALHALGFRYRLHDSKLPGRPDLVFPVRKAVVFVHGCFWHGHECDLFRWPASRTEFWRQKIEGNRVRDHLAIKRLRNEGWRSLVVWECALRGPSRRESGEVVLKAAEWLRSARGSTEIRGMKHGRRRRTQ